MAGTNCKIGSRCLDRRDSDLFSPGSAERRLKNAITAIELSEGKSIAALSRGILWCITTR